MSRLIKNDLVGVELFALIIYRFSRTTLGSVSRLEHLLSRKREISTLFFFPIISQGRQYKARSRNSAAFIAGKGPPNQVWTDFSESPAPQRVSVANCGSAIGSLNAAARTGKSQSSSIAWSRPILHSGSQAANRCVSFPVQYQAIQIRTNHRKVRQIQAGDRPGTRTAPHKDRATRDQ